MQSLADRRASGVGEEDNPALVKQLRTSIKDHQKGMRQDCQGMVHDLAWVPNFGEQTRASLMQSRAVSAISATNRSLRFSFTGQVLTKNAPAITVYPVFRDARAGYG